MNDNRPRQSLALGAVFIVASEFLLASTSATVKTAAQDLPLEMLVFFRNIFGLAALAPLFFRKNFSGLKTRVIHLHILRAMMGLIGMYSFFFAITHLNLADAMVLKLTAPIFIPWIAWLWLGEKFPMAAVWAVVVGFIGVSLILRPGEEGWNWVVLVALIGSLAVSGVKVTIRRLSVSEPAVRIVFYFAVIASLISAIPLWWAWQTPTFAQWLLLILIGVLATGGQLLMTRGYSLAPAGQVAVFGYSSVLFGAFFGWFFWREVWDGISIIGALFIFAAGILVLTRRRDPTVVSPE